MLNHQSSIIASPWLPPRIAAAYLGIAIGTLRNWTSFGRVPYVKRGRVVRYHRDELDQWLAAAKGNGTRGIILANIPETA
jgi:excisionase family DNA binding protein